MTPMVDRPMGFSKKLSSHFKGWFASDTLRPEHHTPHAQPRMGKDDTLSHRTDVFDAQKHFRELCPDPLPFGESVLRVRGSNLACCLSHLSSFPSGVQEKDALVLVDEQYLFELATNGIVGSVEDKR